MPPWDGGASSFPQAADVGSTGWGTWLSPSRIALRLEVLAPTFPRSGGRPADDFAIHGAAIIPLSLVVVSSPVCLSVNLLGGTCLCTAGLRCPRAALTDDLAGTMQSRLVSLDEPLLASHEVSYMTSIPNFLSHSVKLVSQQRRTQRLNVFHSLAAAAPQHRACKTLFLLSREAQDGASKLHHHPSSCTSCLALRDRHAVSSSSVFLIRQPPKLCMPDTQCRPALAMHGGCRR